MIWTRVYSLSNFFLKKYLVNGQFELSDPEAINEELHNSYLMRSLRALIMPSVIDEDLPEMSEGFNGLRNLQKKSKEKHRLLFTRMGRAAGADVDTPPGLFQNLRSYNAHSRFRR